MALPFGFARLHTVYGLLVLQMFSSCADQEESVSPPTEVVTEPIPPPGLFDDLPPDQRRAELEKLSRGTPIEELPEDERRGVTEANRNEILRAPVREALRSFATVQSARANELAARAHEESP